MVGFYLAISVVISLRGPEAFMVEISLLQQCRLLNSGLVWIPLQGKLKGKDNIDIYLMRSVPVTTSGIKIFE